MRTMNHQQWEWHYVAAHTWFKRFYGLTMTEQLDRWEEFPLDCIRWGLQFLDEWRWRHVINRLIIKRGRFSFCHRWCWVFVYLWIRGWVRVRRWFTCWRWRFHRIGDGFIGCGWGVTWFFSEGRRFTWSGIEVAGLIRVRWTWLNLIRPDWLIGRS